MENLLTLTLTELKSKAKELGIKNISKLKKGELAEKIAQFAKDEKPQKKTLEGVCRSFCRSSSLRGHEPDFLASYPGISV